MEYKDDLISELVEYIEYNKILELLDMKDDVDFAFDSFLDNLSDEDLIKLFEDYCYDLGVFLGDREYSDE